MVVAVEAATNPNILVWDLLGGGGARGQVWYDAHLPTLSLWDGNKSWTLLTGTVLLTLHGHVIFKNWHL